MTAAGCCPTCGQSLPDGAGLRVDLDRHLIVRGAEVVRVWPIHAALVHTLLARHPKVVRFDPLISALWGVNEPRDAKKNLLVQVCRLRPLVAPLGIEILNHWGVGYSLEINDLPERCAA